MFTHRVRRELKSDSLTEFSRHIKSELMPLVRLQRGFRNERNFLAPTWTAIEDTRRETGEDAEAYRRTGYQKVLKSLSGLSLHKPTASIFEFVE